MNPLVQTSNLTIHPKILTEICMQLVLMVIPQQIIKFWFVPVVCTFSRYTPATNYKILVGTIVVLVHTRDSSYF